MKNKKIVSLICALAMIFSMFSAMTVSAADKKGINLASTISTDNKTITLDATAVGTEELLNSFLISVNLPEGVTNDNVTATTAADTKLSVNVAGSVLNVAFLDTAGDGNAFKDGKLATITIKLPTALTEAYAFTLTSEASIEDSKGEITVAKGMTAASTVVTPSTEPVPTVNPVKTVALKSVVSTGYGDAIKAAKDAGKDVYLTVDVNKGDQDAVYVGDYETVYNDKTLTEA